MYQKALEEEDFSADLYKWTKIINDNYDEKAKLRFSEKGCSYTFWNLIVIKDIEPKEELTIKYEWYKPVERVVL